MIRILWAILMVGAFVAVGYALRDKRRRRRNRKGG